MAPPIRALRGAAPAFLRRTRFIPLAGAAAAMALSGCAELSTGQPDTAPPVVSAITTQNLSLRNLPAPASRVQVAVYDLPDLTGQFRERENVQSLSRAVSQGGAPMLIKALQDAGEASWFSILDRSNLDNLLRERQIATEMRRLYRGEERPDPLAVPPLGHAGIIIQGGIVGYDSNTQTGGFGARYLGVGGDKQWKLDIVTVSLRAVSSATGEVLASVMVEKPIASVSLRGGVFSYIEMDKLLEIETGMAANEPKQLATQMAIEKAVYALIMEGAQVGLWSFRDKTQGKALVSDYLREKYRGTDALSHPVRVTPPMTQNAAHVVPTRPLAPRPRPVVEARVLPPEVGAQLPPPPGEGETLE